MLALPQFSNRGPFPCVGLHLGIPEVGKMPQGATVAARNPPWGVRGRAEGRAGLPCSCCEAACRPGNAQLGLRPRCFLALGRYVSPIVCVVLLAVGLRSAHIACTSFAWTTERFVKHNCLRSMGLRGSFLADRRAESTRSPRRRQAPARRPPGVPGGPRGNLLGP